MGIWTVSPVRRSKRPSCSGQATTQPASSPTLSGAAMCGQRSSVTTMPSSIQATSRSRSARVTRRIVPGARSATAAISTNGAARVPGRAAPGDPAMGRDRRRRGSGRRLGAAAASASARRLRVGQILGRHGVHDRVDRPVVAVRSPSCGRAPRSGSRPSRRRPARQRCRSASTGPGARWPNCSKPQRVTQAQGSRRARRGRGPPARPGSRWSGGAGWAQGGARSSRRSGRSRRPRSRTRSRLPSCQAWSVIRMKRPSVGPPRRARG